jgi:polyhydroxybutyrate depolymerase
MRIRNVIVGVALIFIGLPVVVVLIGLVWLRILNRTNGTLVSSGQKRQYLLYVPPSYDSAKPTPLVISMHGAAGWPAQQRDVSRWNRTADANGFIVVYPSATDTPRIWHVEEGPDLERDVRFISELIDKLEASYHIDPMRIYANGLSNGGGMSFVLSCAMSERIAAVGMVAAAQTLPSSWCKGSRPMPMIAFHGTADPIVPYNGGKSPIAPPSVRFPGFASWTSDWAVRNGCGVAPVASQITANVSRVSYVDCAGGADVVVYTIRGGGHSWPGGKPLPEWLVGTTSNEIDTTALMWKFFCDHPLKRAEAPAPK